MTEAMRGELLEYSGVATYCQQQQCITILTTFIVVPMCISLMIFFKKHKGLLPLNKTLHLVSSFET